MINQDIIRVEYGPKPLSNGHEFDHLPYFLKDPHINILYKTRWVRITDTQFAYFVAFISNEDANYLILKYPGIDKDFYKI